MSVCLSVVPERRNILDIIQGKTLLVLRLGIGGSISLVNGSRAGTWVKTNSYSLVTGRRTSRLVSLERQLQTMAFDKNVESSKAEEYFSLSFKYPQKPERKEKRDHELELER
jgi:hypothetical protein